MPTESQINPIYKSRGEVGAYLSFPYIFSVEGEWIGWITADRSVYSVHGHYVGVLSNEMRILRNREFAGGKRRLKPPSPPPPLRLPGIIPLAPQLPEVMLNMIDVLEDAPELMPPTDYGDLRDDLD
jgi:4-fold beta flower protein